MTDDLCRSEWDKWYNKTYDTNRFIDCSPAQMSREAWFASKAYYARPAAVSDTEALQEAVAMADEARKYLLERPANKVKCNIMLLRLVQKFCSKDSHFASFRTSSANPKEHKDGADE